jgi:glycosyltransferase involved in cell wall biosynthesis
MGRESDMAFTFSLIVPCYNEARTIEKCIEKLLVFSRDRPFTLELIVVDDASTDGSFQILEEMARQHNEIRVLRHEKNRGKGAALRTGFIHAAGDFVGIQDADAEYDPHDYLAMLEPLLDGRADVVYGSRYLRPDTRRVLYFWHTWMNKTLTGVSNMFTNLDITDMETCYKLFRRDVIQKIAPELKEERFGFEPEITAKVAEAGCRVYECAISYNPRTYEEGKKIGWKDGIHALYCIFH